MDDPSTFFMLPASSTMLLWATFAGITVAALVAFGLARWTDHDTDTTNGSSPHV